MVSNSFIIPSKLELIWDNGAAVSDCNVLPAL